MHWSKPSQKKKTMIKTGMIRISGVRACVRACVCGCVCVCVCVYDQVIDFPTRIDNTLDIFGTNRPSLIDRCVPLPGISDHDVVLVDSIVLPAGKKPVRRKVYLWKRTNK